jgi:small subunit ribosomal protein S1
MAESFAELFEQEFQGMPLKRGDVLKGKIVGIDDKFVTVDVGLKSESFIPVEQFQDGEGNLEAHVDDEVEVALEAIENGFGETALSRDKAKRIAAWRDLETAHEEGDTVKGFVVGRIKGGFTVDIHSVKGFLPGSLIDIRPVRDPSFLEGQYIDVKVIKMDVKRNNVVVSRRAVMEAESQEERAALLESLDEGQQVKGVVKNLTDYGAFIDLGGVDGLLHITDMSWKRIKHPSELLTIGDEITVKILKFDRDRNRVSLGYKQLGEDPWLNINDRYPIGSRLLGHVSNITDYGCFVEIEPGVEGLVHVSEMDWTNKNVNPAKIVSVGDEIEVMALEIDEERRRISLGIKQCKPNPWKQFAENHQTGEHIHGKIKSITDFGIFIGLEGEIDGLVHLSDISWDKSGEESVKDYSKNQEVDAVILGIEPDRERISLGMKQLEKNPQADFQEQYEKGSVVKGRVEELDEKKAIIDLGEQVKGLLKVQEAAVEKVDDLNEVLSAGDEVEARIIGFDNKNGWVNLSIRAMHEEPKGEYKSSEASKKKKYTPKTQSGKGNIGGATLGDLLKEQMENKEEE